MENSIFNKKSLLLFLIFPLILSCFFISKTTAFAMPFFDLEPKNIVLRASFSTSFSSSSEERKNNIRLATKSINKYLLDVGGEFSFNRVVGKRTENRGYKKAKIIVNGEFTEGVGGGVCQVSTTLYNTALLGGMTITECHPHSLKVGYVPPSFDAMVNSGTADLKFRNDTKNPILIFSSTDGNKITFEIYGEPLDKQIELKSVTIKELPATEYEQIVDENGDYPNLYEGETLVLKHGMDGLKSEGYLLEKKNGKIIKNTKIRSDKYNPTKGVVVIGKAVKEEQSPLPPLFEILKKLIYNDNS